MKQHLILVGLPGSGKTTVGRLLLKLRSTDFTDFTDVDEAVEIETGSSIAQIFAESGEQEFRRLERAAMERALAGPPQLIAAGAGWIAEPGNLAAARAKGAWVVYLRVPPEVAAARLGDAASRPLLAGSGPDRKARLQELLEARESWYLQADAQVDAQADPATVAARVASAMRGSGAGRD